MAVSLIFLSYCTNLAELPEGLVEDHSIKTAFLTSYQKNPLVFSSILGVVIATIQFFVLDFIQVQLENKNFSVKKIQKKYDEFVSNARELYLFGGDLDFIDDCPKQKKKILKMKNKCKILCDPCSTEESKRRYIEFKLANVDIRTFASENCTFTHLRGQIKKANGNHLQCLITEKLESASDCHYRIVTVENLDVLEIIKEKFDQIFEEADEFKIPESKQQD